jgi:hypothetical protein
MKMKFLTIATLTLITQMSYANEVNCRVQTLYSGCGSGEITINLDLERNTFDLQSGDIRCWGSDQKYIGVLKESQKQKRGYSGKVYGLSVKQAGVVGFVRDVEEFDLGTLEYEKISYTYYGGKALRLTALIQVQRPTGSEHEFAFRGSEYLLKCDEVKSP